MWTTKYRICALSTVACAAARQASYARRKHLATENEMKQLAVFNFVHWVVPLNQSAQEKHCHGPAPA
jgi:hypothetical protein